MNDLSTVTNIPSTSKDIDLYLMSKACDLADKGNLINPPVEHWIENGVYYRATFYPAYSIAISCMIKVPTTIVVAGNCLVTVGDHVEHLLGIRRIEASANRRVAYKTLDGGVFILMYFKTSATTVEDAEHEMTDEYSLLTNHREELDT